VTVIDGPLVDGKVIDGKAFAAALRGRIATHAASFEAATGRKAGLAVVLVGEDPASSVYVRSKGKQTVEAGMASFEHRLPADTDEATLLALIGQLNADPAVDGILVQLPCPRISPNRPSSPPSTRTRMWTASTPPMPDVWPWDRRALCPAHRWVA
jgi:hypothetical protein